MAATNYDVFISHGAADTVMARLLADRLSSLNLRVFLDIDRIKPGENWRGIISNALEEATVVAILLSSGTRATGFAALEIVNASESARRGRSLLIPVYLDEQSARNAPRGLEKFRGIRLLDDSELGIAAQKIAKAVADTRPAPPSSGPVAVESLTRSIERLLDEPDNALKENGPTLSVHVRQLLSEADGLDDDDALNNLLQLGVRLARLLTQDRLYEHSAELLEDALAASERILGPDDPTTLTVRANLAGLYQELGRREEALVLLQQTLAASERILGPDHLSTLTVRANLAGLYQELGRREEALVLLQQTLAASERILGPDDPTTLTVRANLEYVRNGPEGVRHG